MSFKISFLETNPKSVKFVYGFTVSFIWNHFTKINFTFLTVFYKIFRKMYIKITLKFYQTSLTGKNVQTTQESDFF